MGTLHSSYQQLLTTRNTADHVLCYAAFDVGSTSNHARIFE